MKPHTKYGNIRVHPDGYYYITSRKEGNHGKSLHRLVWEDHYKTKIPESYNIPHITGNKLDNRIQNLQCVRNTIHKLYHSIKRRHQSRKFPKRNAEGSSFLKKCPEGRCWQSKIQINGKRVSLGVFEDFLSASIVYNLVANETRSFAHG